MTTNAIEKLEQQEQLAADGLKTRQRDEAATAATAATKAKDAYRADNTE